jgi:hypothetical protein
MPEVTAKTECDRRGRHNLHLERWFHWTIWERRLRTIFGRTRHRPSPRATRFPVLHNQPRNASTERWFRPSLRTVGLAWNGIARCRSHHMV